jgi:glyoxylase-like metal-dependent hydrolase (beta-lactamase superfamily II)/rhodanese-related sulfurtransferase
LRHANPWRPGIFANLVFRQLYDAASSTYTYLLGDPGTRQAVIIDSVFEQHLRDFALLGELNLKLVSAVDTHCHADHVTGAWMMQQATGCRIGISRRYQPPIEGVDLPLDHGDHVAFGGRRLEVRATPGHTDGCMTLVLDDRSMAFTGDALLIRGAGRCDFQRGDAHILYRSIVQQIFSLPETCLLFPGHDYSGRTVTSVGEERAHNPRIGGGADERDFVGFMENLNLPHPKQIDVALPANLRSGRPADGKTPRPADWGPVRQTYAGLLEIEPEWVAEHLQQVHVLDVRQPQEMQESLGSIAGSQPIPLNELKARLSEIPRDKPVVAVCHAGMRSGQATVILRSAGLERCANLRGGMLLWSQLGLPAQRQRVGV